jgi:putative membrane protein
MSSASAETRASAGTSAGPTPGVLPSVSDRAFFGFNALVSSLALALLAYLLLIRGGTAGTSLDLRFMPAVNAGLNATAATLLAAGWVAIKLRKPNVHKYLVVAAFASSALFLVGYLAYHAIHGDTKYAGTGVLRPIYFTLLISHILLSVVVVPGALAAFWFAARRQFARHTKVTRWLMPIWLYVSVTGVVIFFMLRGSAPAVP